MSSPTARTIARTGRGTASPEDDAVGAASWDDVATLLRAGEGTSWLSVRGRDGGVHTRPLFAAWTGSSFVFATKDGAVKTGHLSADGAVSLAIDLGELHLVVAGAAARLTATADLERASRAMSEVYEWPTEVVGEELDAEYAAPTSGGPPFQAWEITPTTVHAFPTADQVEPTRFDFA